VTYLKQWRGNAVSNITQNEKSTLGTKSYDRRTGRFKRTTDRRELVPFPIQKPVVRQTEQLGTGRRAKIPERQNVIVSDWQPKTCRGLKRIEASDYIGVSASKFDELVKDGRMPPPKRIDGRVVWDIRQVDAAFDSLPGGGDDDHQNPWDE
jgi:predicted DNA-binding transcriptional regulator AlpA